jgi:NAD(P)-dependent dehydrogenase (short-subunit alcohol dehydrogenase family)
VELRDKVVVVTGGAHGIGAALARRFAKEGATGVVVSDLDGDGATAVANDIGARAKAVRTDVTDPEQMTALVTATEDAFGPIDLFCSNAGIASGVGLDADPEVWAAAWSVNVQAHVYAARAVVPSMIARGSGYLLNTVSSAGLLTCPGDAPYTATKHAALGLAEWLSMTYGPHGIGVSALCPLGVRTDMLMPSIEAGHASALAVQASGQILEPAQVAESVVAGLAEERFLILPHPEVATLYAHKASDPDRWLAGMRKHFGGIPA